jgi:hypothetical protein
MGGFAEDLCGTGTEAPLGFKGDPVKLWPLRFSRRLSASRKAAERPGERAARRIYEEAAGGLNVTSLAHGWAQVAMAVSACLETVGEPPLVPGGETQVADEFSQHSRSVATRVCTRLLSRLQPRACATSLSFNGVTAHVQPLPQGGERLHPHACRLGSW